jgi:signal transduction histidine kinase
MATLYRVVRATLVDAHASAAGQVRVTLTPTASGPAGAPRRVRLVVADDGMGLDPARADRSSESYLRMQLLHDRVANLQGELVVTSAPGQGTTVRVDLPVQPVEDRPSEG